MVQDVAAGVVVGVGGVVVEWRTEMIPLSDTDDREPGLDTLVVPNRPPFTSP